MDLVKIEIEDEVGSYKAAYPERFIGIGYDLIKLWT